jgi:hypothetical protein
LEQISVKQVTYYHIKNIRILQGYS